MATDSLSDETVLFELPSPTFASRLMKYVGSQRFAWLQSEQWVPMVGVVLFADELDLARLLRSVQRWLALEGLSWIHFELDGRTYVLKPRELALATG
jgi:hypothetical protein